MKKSNKHFWITLLVLFLGFHTMTSQEIKIHNLPQDFDFSTLKPLVWDKDGDNKIYIPVVFARSKNDYFFLKENEILEFDKEMVDYYSLDKNEELFSAINYKGPYRIPIYNIKLSKREKLLELYL